MIKKIDVSGKRVQPTPAAGSIGVLFDKQLSFDKHVTNLCKTCFVYLFTCTAYPSKPKIYGWGQRQKKEKETHEK